SAVFFRSKNMSVAVGILVALLAAACHETLTQPTPVPTAQALIILQGNNQVGSAGELVGTNIGVEVRDANQQPIVGTPLVWQVTTGGGSLASYQSVTDPTGRASALWRLGTDAQNQTLSVTTTGTTPIAAVVH